MRIIGSVESGGIQYDAIWASLSWINPTDTRSGNALAIRTADGKTEAIIPRNAKLAEVQQTLHHLQTIGLKPSQLCKLFNLIGDKKGLAQHVKVLVSRLN